MATTTAKVCRICMVDCSERPRTKDELGRYTCKACLDREEARMARGTSAPRNTPADDDGMGDIRAAAMIEAKTAALDLPDTEACPKCHNYMPAADRMCLRCGFDRKRGCKLSTRCEKEKPDPADRQEREVRLWIDPTVIALLLAVPVIGAGVWAFTDHAQEPVFLIAYAVYSLLTSVAVLGAQWRDRAFGYVALMAVYIASFIVPLIALANKDVMGMIGGALLVGGLGLLAGLCQLYWVFVESGRTYLQAAWCCCIVMKLMQMVLNWTIAAAIINEGADAGF